MRTALSIISALTIATTSIAGVSRSTILTGPETPWHKRSGDFVVHLAVSTNARDFVSAWEAEQRVELRESTITVIPTKVEFGVFLLFANCPLNAKLKCDVGVTYQLLSPAGKVLIEHPNLSLWSDLPPNRDNVQHSESLFYSHAEASDPPGDYRLRAVVTDRTSGEQLTLERTLRRP